jgi:spore germination protein GerM
MPKHTQVDLINDPVQRAAEMSKLQLEAAIELLRSGPKKNPLREAVPDWVRMGVLADALEDVDGTS